MSDAPLLQKILRRGRSAASRVVRERIGRRRGQRSPEVTIQGRAAGRVEGGETLLRAALQLGVDLDHFCGGYCSCGTCRVKILAGAENLSSLQVNEEMVLGAAARGRGDRLACQARVLGPVTIEIPDFYGG